MVFCRQHVPGADAGAAAAAGRLREAEARGGRQVRQTQRAHVSVALSAQEPRQGRQRGRQPAGAAKARGAQGLRVPQARQIRYRIRIRDGRRRESVPRGEVALGNPQAPLPPLVQHPPPPAASAHIGHHDPPHSSLSTNCRFGLSLLACSL